IDSLLLDEHNRLQHLQQSGWSLEIRRYRQQGDLQLPELLVLEREQIRIKLKINRWQVNHEKGE
ncbi:MAG TPA: outer membrane lipoprotein LolB, partial [Gammaproteobacteria bacterium]|nr:outer membrane lipoprotein LolB [Gammaproteobacteria bacterium]